MSGKREHTIGIVGVGHLTAHMVPGLLRADPAPNIVLSPRGREHVAQLERAYDVEIAASNEEVVDRCATVLLGVRPFQALQAVEGLPWRSDHTLVSLCAGVTIADLSSHLNGASVVRAMPVIAAKFGHSPTCIHPAHAATESLLASCGPVIAVEREIDVDNATINACYSSWMVALVDTVRGWNEAAGFDAPTARRLAVLMTRAVAETCEGRDDVTLAELTDELAIPNSVTGDGLEKLRDAGALSAWTASFDLISAQIRK